MKNNTEKYDLIKDFAKLSFKKPIFKISEQDYLDDPVRKNQEDLQNERRDDVWCDSFIDTEKFKQGLQPRMPNTAPQEIDIALTALAAISFETQVLATEHEPEVPVFTPKRPRSKFFERYADRNAALQNQVDAIAAKKPETMEVNTLPNLTL